MTESEWLTRKKRIDTRLTGLKPPWRIIPWKDGLDTRALTHHAVIEYETANGPADYVLFVKGKVLGIIEAKKVTVDPRNVLNQAMRYAKGVKDGVGNWNGYPVPFLHATNGEVIWHIDMMHERPSSRDQ